MRRFLRRIGRMLRARYWHDRHDLRDYMDWDPLVRKVAIVHSAEEYSSTTTIRLTAIVSFSGDELATMPVGSLLFDLNTRLLWKVFEHFMPGCAFVELQSVSGDVVASILNSGSELVVLSSNSDGETRTDLPVTEEKV